MYAHRSFIIYEIHHAFSINKTPSCFIILDSYIISKYITYWYQILWTSYHVPLKDGKILVHLQIILIFFKIIICHSTGFLFCLNKLSVTPTGGENGWVQFNLQNLCQKFKPVTCFTQATYYKTRPIRILFKARTSHKTYRYCMKLLLKD